MGIFFLNMGEEMVLGYIPVPLLLISMTATAVGNSFPSTTYDFLQLQEVESSSLQLEACTH